MTPSTPNHVDPLYFSRLVDSLAVRATPGAGLASWLPMSPEPVHDISPLASPPQPASALAPTLAFAQQFDLSALDLGLQFGAADFGFGLGVGLPTTAAMAAMLAAVAPVDAARLSSPFAQQHALLAAGVQTVVVPDSLPSGSLPADMLPIDLFPANDPRDTAAPAADTPSPRANASPFLAQLGAMTPPVSPAAPAFGAASHPSVSASSPANASPVSINSPAWADGHSDAGATTAAAQQHGPRHLASRYAAAPARAATRRPADSADSDDDEQGTDMGDADFLPSDEDPASDEDNAIANDDSDDEGSCYGSDVRPRAPRMSLTSSAQSADSTMSGDSIVTAKPLRRGPRRAADPANYRFPCTLCDRAFTRKYNLEAHILVHQNRKPYSCSHKNCSEAFVRKYDLKRHIRTIHQRTYYGPCPHCQRQYSRIDSYRKHVRLCDLQHEEDSDA